MRKSFVFIFTIACIMGCSSVAVATPITVKYTYDDSYRLTGVEYVDDGTSITYSYDAAGNRLMLYSIPGAPDIDESQTYSGYQGGIASIPNLVGKAYQRNATVKLTRTGYSDILGQNIQVLSPIKISCEFDLTTAALGYWIIVVINPDAKSDTYPNGLNVMPQTTIPYWYLY